MPSPMTFSWDKWTPNTTLSMVNVPWDMSYRDIVKFDTKEQQDSYFDNLPSEKFEKTSYAKFGIPIDIPVAFNKAQKYNYLVSYNDYPDLDAPRKWYYFITSCQFVSAGNTRITIMLDVWQSFQFDVQLGNCYVERGHIGVANEKQFDDYGCDYLAIPEGLDTGTDTRIHDRHWVSLVSKSKVNEQDKNEYSVMLVTNTDFEADWGDEQNPKLHTAKGSTFGNLSNGCSFYMFLRSDFIKFMEEVSKYPWVSQGITAIYMVPNNAINADTSESATIHGIFCRKMKGDEWKKGNNELIKDRNFRNSFYIPERYRYLKKFLVYPYAMIELTSLNGTSVILKPEQIWSDDLTIRYNAFYGFPGARIRFYPKLYNSGASDVMWPMQIKDSDQGDDYGTPIDGGEGLSAAVGIDDFPQFTIVNNNAISAVASQAHSLAWSYQSANWAQSKTMAGANNAYKQSQMSTGYNDSRTYLANQQAMTNYGIGAAGSALGAAANIMGGANPLGTLAQTGIGLAQGAVQTASNNSYRNANNELNNDQTMQFADMNKDLSTAVAKGDYANTIAGINAKVQDTQLTQPSNSGAMGGDSFNLSNGNLGLMIRWRQLAPNAMYAIGEFWLRYGYYVQRFLTPPTSLKCMTKFTYWKMHELYIRSSTCPEEYRMTIKGIFEKGVTVWSNPNDIGVIDYADNEPLKGISY